MHIRSTSPPPGMPLSLAASALAMIFALLAFANFADAQQASPQRLALEASQDTGRVHAIDHSDAYYTRLTIHRIGSYTMLPMFAGQYWLGQKLTAGGDVANWVRPAHTVVAGTLGALFAVNTVTGLWNLYEARRDESPARRYLHAALMLAADAGFAYTGLIASEAKNTPADADRHRNAALVSMSASTAGVLIMWLWQDNSN